MSESDQRPSVPPAPAGSNTVNPFIWTHDAAGLLEFLVAVFEAREVHDAPRTPTASSCIQSC